MMSRDKILLPLAIAAVLATAACNREATDADAAGDTAVTEPAATDPAAAPADPMATAPAAPPPADGMATDPNDPNAMAGAQPMTPPPSGTAAMATTSTASVSGMDKNADGGLSMEELPAGDMLRDHFSTADGDGNGMLSQAEIDKHNSDMASKPAQ